MINLLIKTLNETNELVERSTPKIKWEGKLRNISDISPSNLQSFMEKKGIPNDATFSYYDYGLYLYWDEEIPTTELDKVEYRKNRFNRIIFGQVNKKLTANGYKRISPSYDQLRQYGDIDLYNTYMAKEFKILEAYFSLFFVLDKKKKFKINIRG